MPLAPPCTCADCGAALDFSDDTVLACFRTVLAEAFSIYEVGDYPPEFQQGWTLGVLSGSIAAGTVVTAIGEAGLERILDRMVAAGEFEPHA
jgi:hypothetical protein